MLTVGSLFAGIGGFDLGFERAGFEVRWQVEIDPFCWRVLEKHWPDVQRYPDIRHVHGLNAGVCGGRGRACGSCLPYVDVVVGGFPCQDISSNNQYKRGLAGSKSGLFTEAIRVAGELRPRYLVLENVADLLVRGMGTVLSELAAIGYDAEWDCVPAALVGLPQPRWRVFIIAYPGRSGREASHKRVTGGSLAILRADRDRLAEAEHAASEGPARVCGMDDGFPDRMDRVGACGNAVAPKVAEWIARRILEAESVTA